MNEGLVCASKTVSLCLMKSTNWIGYYHNFGSQNYAKTTMDNIEAQFIGHIDLHYIFHYLSGTWVMMKDHNHDIFHFEEIWQV